MSISPDTKEALERFEYAADAERVNRKYLFRS